MSDPNPVVEFPPFRLDVADQRLWHDAEPIELRPKTYEVLHYLVERPGKLVRTESLLEAVWEGAAITPGNLNNSIHELRKALGDNARDPKFIETVHRRGFRFVAPVSAATTAPLGPSPSPPQPSPSAQPTPSESQPTRNERARSFEQLVRDTDRAWRDQEPARALRTARRAIDLLAEATRTQEADVKVLSVELARSLLALGVASSGRERLLEEGLGSARRIDTAFETELALARLPNEQRSAILGRYLTPSTPGHGSGAKARERGSASTVLHGLARLGELDGSQT